MSFGDRFQFKWNHFKNINWFRRVESREEKTITFIPFKRFRFNCDSAKVQLNVPPAAASQQRLLSNWNRSSRYVFQRV